MQHVFSATPGRRENLLSYVVSRFTGAFKYSENLRKGMKGQSMWAQGELGNYVPALREFYNWDYHGGNGWVSYRLARTRSIALDRTQLTPRKKPTKGSDLLYCFNYGACPIYMGTRFCKKHFLPLVRSVLGLYYRGPIYSAYHLALSEEASRARPW